MRRFALILTMSFLLVFSAHAQDGYPLPDNLPPITTDNAAQLTKLASVGGVLPGGRVWSPDGKHLAVGTSENVQIFDTEHLDAAPVIIPSPELYGSLYFDLHGPLGEGDDYSVYEHQEWDLFTGELVTPGAPTDFPAYSDPTATWEAAWLDDDMTVRLTNTQTGKTVDLHVIDRNIGTLATFDPDAGKAVFVGENTVLGYDLENGDLFMQKPSSYAFSNTLFSRGGDYFITFYGESDALVIDTWKTASPTQPLHNYWIPEDRNFEHRLYFSNDGKRLTDIDTGCYFAERDYSSGRYRVWNALDGDLLVSFQLENCGPFSATVSPDEQWAVTGWRNSLNIFNIADAIQAARADDERVVRDSYAAFTLPDDNKLDITGVTFSPDGNQVAVSLTQRVDDADDLYTIKLFKTQDLLGAGGTFELDAVPQVTITDAQIAQFSPDNAYVLTENGLYDAATGAQLAALPGLIAAFSPDSQLLAAADYNGVDVWDVAALAAGDSTPLTSIPLYTALTVAFNADGSRLYIRRTNDVQTWGVAPAS